MSGQPILTAEGAARLRAELERLIGHDRKEIAARLRAAIQEGDLSENADYHKAKEDQAFLEGRIQELEYLLRYATIVEETGESRDVVEVGARVTVQEEDYPAETFFLVGAKEADPRAGRISNDSPIGSALMGKRAGETAVAETPSGKIHLKVLKIE